VDLLFPSAASLRVAWTLGLLSVVVWTFVGTFIEKGYLERHAVSSGVARLKIIYDSEQPVDGRAYLTTRHYGNWYAEDLIMHMSSAEILLVTKVKEEFIQHDGTKKGSVTETVIEMQQDRADRMLKDFIVATHDHPQAGDLPLHKGANLGFLSTKEMRGVLKRYRETSACGTLWGHGVDEVELTAGSRDELRLVDVICASGINASDTGALLQLVRKGITLSLTYTYLQDASAGIFDHFRGVVPLRYELTAEAYPAQAKVRVVEKLGRGLDEDQQARMRRSVVGITLEVFVCLFVCLLACLLACLFAEAKIP
jgi:hypothetical protein